MSSVISVKYLNGGESWTVVYRNSPPYVLEFDEDLNEIWSIKGFTIFVNRDLHIMRANYIAQHLKWEKLNEEDQHQIQRSCFLDLSRKVGNGG